MAGPGMLSLSRTERYCTKLADEIMKLRGEKSLIDFKIHVKDDEFPCAKFVMAAHSPMLRAMLTSDMAEVAKQEIRLDHIHKDIIQIILDYMYCEDVCFHKDQLMDLIAAADYLQMTELKQVTLDEVPNIMEPANVISWWKEAAKMNYDTTKDQCEEMMLANFQTISQQIDFLNLDLNEMNLYVLDICGDTVNSDDTVDALMRWVGHEEERVTTLEELLHKVELNKCSEKGIKAILKTHEALLDKRPMIYKLLLNRSADAESDRIMTDSVVIVGGQESNANEECWKVSQSNQLVKLCNIPVNALGVNHSVCTVPQGFVVSGGAGSDMRIMFITSTKSWLRLQDMLAKRQSHGTICVKEVLYILGGVVGSNERKKSTNSVDSMAMERGKWVEGPWLPRSVTFPKVSNLDDRVYLLDEESCQLLCLDINKEVWHRLAPLPAYRSFPGARSCIGVSMTSARGRLFVAGGNNSLWYNPKTNTWCKGQQPLRNHKYGALAYHHDKLVLLGGNLEDETGADEVEEYNIEEDKWSLCSYRMPKTLHLHHAVVLSM